MNNILILVRILLGDSVDIKQMEDLGVADYYLRLIEYANEFINRNYPLTTEDIRAIVFGKTTDNVDKRNALDNIMKSEIKKIIETQIEKNTKFVEAIQNGEQVIPESIEIYNQNIFNYQQQILERVWEYRNSNNNLKSQVISENEKLIRDALTNGISSDAVEETLQDVISVAEKRDEIPPQVKDVVKVIVEMKQDKENKIDQTFTSDFVKENNEKINSAIRDGIEPQEIAVVLTRSTQNASTNSDKRNLKFSVNLISKMKKKELKLKKVNESETKEFQKVLK